MEQNYSSLDSLIQKDGEARRYYDSLPQYVKETIHQRAGGVHSLENLRDYAENLLRDDE